MKVDAFYLIKPSPYLVQQLKGNESDTAAFLLESRLIHSSEGGIGKWMSKDRNRDYSAKVKIAFLLWIKTCTAGSEEHREIFRESCLSTEVFDQWWLLERYEVYDDIDDLANEGFNAVPAEDIDITGIPIVDYWVQDRLKLAQGREKGRRSD